jgi:hypothetical protein
MLTSDSFLEKFPEFESRIDEDVLALCIEQIVLETNNYDGVKSDLLRDHCVALRIAYEIEKSYPLNGYLAGNVRKIESLEEAIEYNTVSTSLSDYDSNSYGIRLKRILSANYHCGFAV